jgi:uncharacterized protein
MSQGPVTVAERIGALDVLRGVAVCGILLMNIPSMGLPWNAPLPRLPVAPNADWIAYTVQTVGLAGSMRGLFTLLFGAGMLVMLRGASNAEAPSAQAYLTRCFALMLMGVANFAAFLWPGDILFNYGVCGLVLLLVSKADVRVLLTGAAALLVTLTVFMANQAMGQAQVLRTAEAAAMAKAQGRTLTEAESQAIEQHQRMIAQIDPTPQARAEERAARTSFPAVVGWSTREWAKFNLSSFGAVLLAESLAVMMIGMALFRTGVLSGARSMRLYAVLAIGGYGIGLTVRALFAAAQWRTGFLPDPAVVVWAPLTYELGRIPTTIGLLGLVLMAYKAGVLRPLEAALSAIGRLALTNYLGQSIITSVLFYGLGLFDRFGFAQLMGIAAMIWLGQAVFSLLWLKRWQMGPAEWLLRSLAYGRWRPLERTAARPQPLPAAAE